MFEVKTMNNIAQQGLDELAARKLTVNVDAENPDAAVALKTHEGTCLGLDHDLYRARIVAAYKSADARRRELDANCRRLLK